MANNFKGRPVNDERLERTKNNEKNEKRINEKDAMISWGKDDVVGYVQSTRD